MSFLKSYIKNEKGNFSVITGIAMVPMLIAVGAVMDHSRLVNINKNLQDAVDNAALGGALAYMRDDEKSMQKDGKKVFYSNANQNDDLKIKSFKVSKKDDAHVYAIASAEVEPMFMSGFGIPKMNVNVEATATIGSTVGAEVSIAIDTTNSMAFGSSWNHTMGTIEKIMGDMQDFTGDDDFYVTLVPFQDRVNIDGASKSWLDHKGFDFDDWDGCVEPREETINGRDWMLDDSSPTSEKFKPTHEDAKMSDGRRIACPKVSLTGPTNDIEQVIKATKKLSTNGTGRFDVGLAWAWRSLSPEWRGKWDVSNYPSKFPKKNPSAKDDKIRKKYIIFMTDGRSNAFKREAMMEEDWGWNNGNKKAFENIAQTCETIQAEGIEIYMLQIPGNSNATPYFKRCASSPDHYIVIDKVEDISFAFGKIKNSLYSQVRLVE
jgi:hypothetical protein